MIELRADWIDAIAKRYPDVQRALLEDIAGDLLDEMYDSTPGLGQAVRQIARGNPRKIDERIVTGLLWHWRRRHPNEGLTIYVTQLGTFMKRFKIAPEPAPGPGTMPPVVLAGDWWEGGDRHFLKVWRLRSSTEHANDYGLVFTIRWRAWTCRYDPDPSEALDVTRGRRGIFFGDAGFPHGFGGKR